MALTSSTATKNAIVSFLTTGSASGFSPIYSLRLYSSGGSGGGGTLLLSFVVSAGAVSSGAAPFSAANVTATVSGTAAVLELWNNAATPALMYSGTVATSGGDLNLASTSIVSGYAYGLSNVSFQQN